MSSPNPSQVPQPPAPPAQQSPAMRNGLGTAGFVLGLVGAVFALIPIVGVIAWPLVILGLIFGILGFLRVRKGQASNRGLAIAGIALSAIGLLICIAWVSVLGKAASDLHEEANRAVTVRYEVTGDASDVTVTYSTFGDENSTTNQEQVTSLPWQKELQTKGLVKGGSLTVTAGPEGGEVTCAVVVDGQEAKTSTASGPFATASCDNFGN
ncbi:MmpS family membrane protein [Prauserella shujinwangii]|uniref:MmpS family membrane protein n=1 Tax=Prauserella shujinwangii TaxID=1453103 RepID=A0A2T0M1K2_9PSEU|nr:DUF4190 domain-containing protein [Prauserella shujinwangii]PRX50486.1 MmpS family membrane protein [Prauserella shujinwangii]